jgi:hypothetical protein
MSTLGRGRSIGDNVGAGTNASFLQQGIMHALVPCEGPRMLRPMRCIGLCNVRRLVNLPLKQVLSKHSQAELFPNQLILGHDGLAIT